MKHLGTVWWAMVLILDGCSSDEDHPRTPAKDQAGACVISAANLGKRIAVEGWAVNRPIGAELVGDDFSIWIDGLDFWPEGYYTGGDRGKRVKVTGVLAEDHALPVFIPEKGKPIPQGIPVPEGTDLYKASHRYLLKDARWELLER